MVFLPFKISNSSPNSLFLNAPVFWGEVKIENVKLLDSSKKLKWKQDSNSLELELPVGKQGEIPVYV